MKTLSMFSARSLLCLFAAVSTLADAAAITLPRAPALAKDNAWKLSVGWNQTVLPASAFGKSIGAFTAPPRPKANAAVVKPAAQLATASQKEGTPGGVFICLNTQWGGECGYAVQPLNECILLASPWLKGVSSFGPDSSASCFAFNSGNCDVKNAQWDFQFPGDDSGGLATTNPWNDRITSFACVPPA